MPCTAKMKTRVPGKHTRKLSKIKSQQARRRKRRNTKK